MRFGRSEGRSTMTGIRATIALAALIALVGLAACGDDDDDGPGGGEDAGGKKIALLLLETEQAITALGKDNIDAVYSANDGMAGGVIAAMKSAGIDPQEVPVTGGDAEVAAIQRILAGEQYMTIYLTIKKQAEVSAQLAVAAAKGDKAPAGLINAKVDNGQERVPSVLLTPVAVTKDNVNDTVIADGFLDPSEICTGKYADMCEEAGIG